MYISMVRKGIRSFAALCLLAPCLAGLPLAAEEKAIELGRDMLWKNMDRLDGLVKAPGRWGFQDLALAWGQYGVEGSTELLLHFDAEAQPEASGAWEYSGSVPAVSDSVRAMGGGSAAFTGAAPGVALVPPSGSLFSTGAAWTDFTIEFWLYPATLSNGETIIAWEGSLRDAGKSVPQGIRVFLRDRKVVWEFKDLFVLHSGKRLPVRLAGTRQILPRTWHHHLLRYQSATGLLEYTLDGLPEAITWATDTGREQGDVAAARVGREHSGPLVLGAGFTGFLDELRLSRRFVEDPVLKRFLGRTGTGISSIVDLGYTGTRVARIEAVTSQPGDSAVQFSYQVSDTWTNYRILKSDNDWVPFRPSESLPESVRGRYVQIMVELFPDGMRSETPRVSSIRIIYEPNIPPVAPAGLTATPGNGMVTLSWRKSTEPGVKGYMVYYGTAPHMYIGAGGALGATGAGGTAPDSPIDAGSSTRLEIKGLENGGLYYFAVVAYDSSEPRQQSAFSAEVSSRPSRMYK
jgi:hypothetical protein